MTTGPYREDMLNNIHLNKKKNTKKNNYNNTYFSSQHQFKAKSGHYTIHYTYTLYTYYIHYNFSDGKLSASYLVLLKHI